MNIKQTADKELTDVLKRAKDISKVLGEVETEDILKIAQMICEKEEHMNNRVAGMYDNKQKTQ